MSIYNNAKIYKIEPIDSLDDGDIYVGKTTKTYLSQRFSKHHLCYKDWKKNGKRFMTSFNLFDKYGYENLQIILLEQVELATKDELKALEGHYIKSMLCVNKNIAGRTSDEYYLENRDKLVEQCRQYKIDNADKMKQYRIDNKEKIQQRGKEYRENNPEKSKQYYEDNKIEIQIKNKAYRDLHPEIAKQYRIDNIEKNKETAKLYREKNKDKIAEKRLKDKDKINEKIACVICDGKYTPSSKSKHFKTPKHLNACVIIENLI